MTDAIVQASRVAGGKYEVTQLQARFVLKSFRAEVLLTLRAGRTVQLAGLGSINVRDVAARPGRNPRTRAPIVIPARKLAALRLTKKAKLFIA